ncbi:MAG: glycosyltransferase family 1 protein, partial [Planctomycetota bacterium]
IQMRIGIDARTMFAPHPRGTGRNLFDAYRTLSALRPQWRFVLYHRRDRRAAELLRTAEGAGFLDAPNVQAVRIDCPGDRWDLWLHLRLPLRARRDGLDVLHTPANAAPANCATPVAATIHDLIPLRVAGEVDENERRRFRRRVERTVRVARRLITPTAATRDDLVQEFGVDPLRVSIVPWAGDSRVQSIAGDPAVRRRAIRRIREKYDLNRPWLLNFSGDSARKNAHRIVRALAAIPRSLRTNSMLVMVGCEPGSLRQELQCAAGEAGVAEHCRFLGFVPHADLPGMICGAAGVLLPSLCEGFGLPLVDAFACGTPALASRGGALQEVAGDAAEYCDP